MYFHATQSFVRDVLNEKSADDVFGNGSERENSESHLMQNLDQYTGGHFLEIPDNAHSLGPRFQMMKSDLEVFAIDNLLGGPRDRNTRADGRHDDNVTIDAALEVPN